MQERLIISLEEWPEEGRQFKGELDGVLFDVSGEEIRSCGNLRYDLDADLFGTELVLRGTLAATFRFICARCLAEFDDEIVLEGLSLSVDVQNRSSIDVTDLLREELVLELPQYPKCAQAGLECQINEQNHHFGLDKEGKQAVESPTPSGKSVWDALDGLGSSSNPHSL